MALDSKKACGRFGGWGGGGGGVGGGGPWTIRKIKLPSFAFKDCASSPAVFPTTPLVALLKTPTLIAHAPSAASRKAQRPMS